MHRIAALLLFMTGSVFASGQLPPGEVRNLIKILVGEDVQALGPAQESLIKAGPNAVPELISALVVQQNQNRAGRIASVLASIGDRRAIGPIIETGARLRGALWSQYLHLDDEVVPEVLRFFDHPSPFGRRIAIEAIYELHYKRYEIASKKPEIVNAYLTRLRDSDPTCRMFAAEMIGRMRVQDAVPMLIAMLPSGVPSDRSSAATALGYIGDRRAVPGIVRLLNDADISVAWSSVSFALRKLCTPEDLPLLIPWLAPEQGDARAYAANILGYIRDKSAIPHLEKLLTDETERVRNAAANAIARIEGRLR